MLLIGYLYGITSERKLVEELRMHLAWRWFTGLGFDQEIPHHSTFSKNRHGRFQESKLFEQLFEPNREAVRGSGTGAGETSVGGWQLRRGECRQREPHSTRAASRSSTSQPFGASVSGGPGTAEPGGGAGSPARPGIDHRSGFHLCHQGRHAGPTGVLRQLSGGQRQLRDRGRTGNSRSDESGDRGRARYADPFCRGERTDRKSTRLNTSHCPISYAPFTS